MSFFCRKSISKFFVVVFPVLIQIIFGGNPLITFRSQKSESKVTIAKSFLLAKSNISVSDEFSSPNSRTCFESGNKSIMRFINRKEIFWSKSNFIMRILVLVPFLPQMKDKHLFDSLLIPESQL